MIIKMNFIVGLALLLIEISFIKALDLKEFTTEDLISAIKNNNYTAVSELLDDTEISANNPKNFNEAIEQALKLQFDKLNLEMLVKYFGTHDNKEERLFGYSAVFNELKSRDKLNDTATVTLAFGLKNLSKENISSETNDAINRLKGVLPKSVKNLAFAKTICIRNFEYNEYLYAASDGFKYDDDRRRVFTWTPGGPVSQGEWVVEMGKGGYYNVKNTYHNEYLYAAVDYFNFWFPGKRRIFTWVPGGSPDGDPQFDWLFVPTGNKVFILNVNYEEVLQMYDPYDSERREITAKTGLVRHSVWEIDDCQRL